MPKDIRKENILKEFDSQTKTLIRTTQQEYVNVSTGETVILDNILKVTFGTKAFWKCYLFDFLTILGIFDSRQADVFVYICENTNQSTNLFIGTYEKISTDVACSRATVAKIMKKLQEHNFIKRVQNGVWMVNPNLLVRGNEHKRQILLSYYQSEKPISQISFSRHKQDPLAPSDENVCITEKTIMQMIEKPEEDDNDNTTP